MTDSCVTGDARLTGAGASDDPLPDRAAARPLACAVVLGSGLFLVVFDSLSVATALPAIRRDLGLQAGQLQWVINMYSLSIAGLLLAGGRAADIFGRRRMLLASLAVLAAGTTVAGLSADLTTLLIGRALQGAAAACALPAALALTGSLFPTEPWRSRAFSVMSVSGGTAGLAGAVFGGLLTDALGWHWIFLMTIPLNAAAVVAAGHYLPSDPQGIRRGRRLDLSAAALGTTGLVAVVYAFGHVETAGGINDYGVLGPLVVGLLLLTGFIVWERHAPDPLVDVHLLRSRRLAGCCIGIAAQSSVHTAVVVIGSLHLQSVHKLSAAGAGAALAPALIATSIGSVVAGRALPRLGARRIGVGTLLVAALSMLGLALMSGWSNYLIAVLPWFVLQGLFNSATYVALSSEAVGEAAEEASDRAVDEAIDEAVSEAVVATAATAPEPVDIEVAASVVSTIEQAIDEAVVETVGSPSQEAPVPAAEPEVVASMVEAVQESVEGLADHPGPSLRPETLTMLLDNAERAAESAAARAREADVAHGVAAGLFETSTHVGGAFAVAVLVSLAGSGAGFAGAYTAAGCLVVAAWIAVLVLIPGQRDRRSRVRVWSLLVLRRRQLVVRAAGRWQARTRRGGGR
ncbi:MAG TPA: MFS transporter [Jatrophihabitans sp.]|uniref:MFS transporter n=1 Tax=Jatrophihabitans sp. TaxID=1932789 RepID=UPI002EF15C8B